MIRQRVAAATPVWLRHRYVRAEHRLRIAAKSRLSTPERTFLIVADTRTGSSLFEDYLASHPEVETAGECLNPETILGFRTGRHPRPKAATRFVRDSIMSLSAPLAGAKLLLYQLEAGGVSIRALGAALPDLRVLVVYRRSSFLRFVSHEVALATGKWRRFNASSRSGKPPRIHLNRDEFLSNHAREVSGYRALVESCERNFPGRYRAIAYEDFVDSPQQVFDGFVFPFLRLSSSRVETKLVRQSPRELDSVIWNLTDLGDLRATTLDLAPWMSDPTAHSPVVD